MVTELPISICANSSEVLPDNVTKGVKMCMCVCVWGVDKDDFKDHKRLICKWIGLGLGAIMTHFQWAENLQWHPCVQYIIFVSRHN